MLKNQNLKLLNLKSTNFFKIKENKNFKNLQNIILNHLFKSKNFSTSYNFLNKKLNSIKLKDLRENNNLMIKIEHLILNILNDLNIKNIKSLQYPVNIRISENKNFPKKYREYDTRFVHCDSWSGAPKDSFNAFIYLIASEKAPKIEIYKSLPKTHRYRDLKGKYSSFNLDKKYLKRIKFKAEPGNMAIWETATPHKTIVNNLSKKKFHRISIDFRFKKTSPYTFQKKYKSESFYKSKMNNDGVYWSINNLPSPFNNINDKIKYEMSIIEKNKFFYKLRKKYIKKYYKYI